MKTWIGLGVLMVLTLLACTGGGVTEEEAKSRIATTVAKALIKMPTPTTASPVTDAAGPAITPPVTPGARLVGQALEPGISYTDVFVSDGLAYVAGSRGLRIMDVSNPTTPAVVGRLGGAGRRVFVAGA